MPSTSSAWPAPPCSPAWHCTPAATGTSPGGGSGRTRRIAISSRVPTPPRGATTMSRDHDGRLDRRPAWPWLAALLVVSLGLGLLLFQLTSILRNIELGIRDTPPR